MPAEHAGQAASPSTAGSGSFHAPDAPPPTPGAPHTRPGREQLPAEGSRLPLSGSLPGACRTQLLCLLCPGQSVVSLPASEESACVICSSYLSHTHRPGPAADLRESPDLSVPTPTTLSSDSQQQPGDQAAQGPTRRAHLCAALPTAGLCRCSGTTRPGSSSIQLLSPAPWPHAGPGQSPSPAHLCCSLLPTGHDSPTLLPSAQFHDSAFYPGPHVPCY